MLMTVRMNSDLSLGCYLTVVVVCCLAGDMSTPQRSAHYTVGDQHHQQREQVDQHYDCKLVTAEGERESTAGKHRKGLY